MSGNVATDHLHSLTVASIDSTAWACGCHPHDRYPTLTHLCDYHEGFEDGICAYLEGPNE